MALMTASVRTAAPATNVAFAELRASTRPLRVKQIEVYTVAATATGVGLAEPGTAGTGPTTTFPGYSTALPVDDRDPAGAAVLASAWTVAPTAPGAAQGWRRRALLPAVVGAGIIWTPSAGADDIMVVAASATVALYNLAAATGSALDVTFVWDE